jgi:hypothetical protein
MRGLEMNSNSLYIYYFNIKEVYLIDIGNREKVGKREKE